MNNKAQSHDLSQPYVTIVLPVYNGANFLPALLESLTNQSYTKWTLLISDDGSTDASHSILMAFQEKHPDRVALSTGPQSGITANYLSLIEQVAPTAAVTLFCDQDDVWLPNRISRALAALQNTEAPVMYCGRTTLINSDGHQLGESPKRNRKPSFANALCQNMTSGNTMAFNAHALQVLQRNVEFARNAPFHDWWAYQLITGIGGTVIHDASPTLLYRQHTENAVGAGVGLKGLLNRSKRASSNELLSVVDGQLHVISQSRDSLTKENARRLDFFIKSRAGGPLLRVANTMRAGLYRQTRIETLLMWALAGFGRF